MFTESLTAGIPLPPMDTAPMRKSEVSSGPLAVAKFIIRKFSCAEPRPSPGPSKTQHIRLVTIKASHFCEKVRWVLDMLEADETSPVYFTEDAHPPAFVAFETVALSGDTTSQTPMIVYQNDKGEVIVKTKSEEILREFLPSLYPKEIENEIRAMEVDLGVRLGAALRCFCYHHLIDLPRYHKVLVKVSAGSTSWIEETLFDKMLDKGIDAGMRKAMVINEETAKTSEIILRMVFSELSQLLEGKDYLMDIPSKSFGFTAADLTLAALAYPLLRPPEMDSFLANMEELPPQLNEMTTELLATKAGEHILKIYSRHRGNIVSLKKGRRNKSIFEVCFSW